MTDKFLS